MLTPSGDVMAAFGVSGEPRLLRGGEGVTCLVGDVVLKPVIDVDESEWTQALMDRVEPDGFRIAEPVRAVDGAWVVDGWAATRFVPDLRAAAPDWPGICAAGLRFCDAVERARVGGCDVLSARTHRWAVADRVAWGDASIAMHAEASELLDELRLLASERRDDEQFVHGDLSGNVFVDASGTPVILDVSPYLRPREWASAIVIADAVLWNGADLALARAFISTDSDRDLLARALIFRMIAEQLADDPRHGALLAPYRAVITALAAA